MHTAQELMLDPRPAQKPDGNACPPIDLDHLARYTMKDRALEREILDLFTQTLENTKTALKQASNPHSWAMAAHTIKGSARAVGAWKLAKLMEDAEAVIEQPPTGKARSDILTDLDTLAAQTTRFIATLPHTS